MPALQLVARNGFKIPGHVLGAGEPLVTLVFASKEAADFFRNSLKWSAFEFKVAEMPTVGDIPEGHLLVSEDALEDGREAYALLSALRAAVAKHGPAQFLVPFEEGEEAPAVAVDQRLVGLVEIAAVETFSKLKEGKVDLIETLANASPDELAELHGIGPKKASEIVESAQALLAERAAAKTV